MKEDLDAHQVPNEPYSVDKTKTAYETWKEAEYEGQVDRYDYEPLNANVRSLIDTGKKIDHLPASQGGAKDVADSLASVVYHLKESGGGITGGVV